MQETGAGPSSSWGELFTGKQAIASLVLSGGIALHAVNTYISATMLPSITADIGGLDYYAWNTSLFILAAIISAAVAGKVLQRIGARQSFFLAGLVFMTGSGLAAIAPNMAIMLLGRSVQGAGGGLIFTFCYSMIAFMYPERLWSRAFALISGTWGITTLFGPAIGGIFAELGVWRAGFGVLVPITILYIIATLSLLPKHRSVHAVPVGQLGLLAGSVLVLSITSVFEEVIWSILGVALSVAMILLLMKREQKASTRLFPKGALAWGSPLFFVFASMALLILCVNTEFFMPFYLQKLFAVFPLWAGYIAATVSIGWASMEVYSARFTDQAMRRVVNVGPVLMALGLITLAVVLPTGTEGNLMLLSVVTLALICIGAGIGIGWPHLGVFALHLTPDDDKENAASALATVQTFAVAFGTALAGLIANSTGFNSTVGTAGIANSAFWLFSSFAVFGILGIFSARKITNWHVSADLKEAETHF
ncbi:MFS transporter [Pseudovibrio sp. WM33]|uniref:MFS transporter n=1 Tax=Pseudovibrio sp. WM33 TaxID=1735585 RepID=UPI0007AE51E6|nr:MFS transporter [Pseudovibrio sp. WM33]KZL24785.1 putative multidrug-efflux transporter [Pseudovibrio sp. WM33]